MNKPLRVAIVGSAPPLRGISSYCLELARSISRHVAVELVSFRSIYPRRLYPGGDLREDPTFPGFEGPTLKIRRSLDWYNPVGWILTAARLEADIVHFQHWSLPLTPVFLTMMIVLKIRRIRTVVTLHNVRDHGRGLLYTWSARFICRLADRVIVHSGQNARTAAETLGVPPGNIRRIRHGVLSFFNDGKGDRESAREHLELPPDAPVALCFGAIRPYKGIDVLLRAFEKVQARLPEAILVIAGKPWMDWAPYGERAAGLNGGRSVRTFLEYIETSEVKHFFLAADCVVLPYTHFDAQSGVGAVALAFSRPMIVSEVGALPELVKEPRCRVPPEDAEALAESLLLGLGDRDFRRQAAADTAVTAREHSWDGIAGETVGLYREVLGR